VTGIGGFAGRVGGFLFSAVLPGIVVTHFGYTPVFLTMGAFHLTGVGPDPLSCLRHAPHFSQVELRASSTAGTFRLQISTFWYAALRFL